MTLGLTPIRLQPDGTAEVVWCNRIDPARAIIRNVPLPESGHRYGDLLLHDGAPSGERQLHGRSVPVFDAIEILRPSAYLTFDIELRTPNREGLDELYRRASEADIGLEDWGTLRCLCTACSRGSPGPAGPEDELDSPDRFDAPIRLMAAATDEAHLRALLDAWTDSDPVGSVIAVAILPTLDRRD